MAGRPRCASCRKAFTPHPRNRTKTENPQRVCTACGPVVGHRLADRRYQASRTGPRRSRRGDGGASGPLHKDTAPYQATGSPGAVQPATALELAGHVGEHLAAIAALVGRACGPSAS